MLLACWVSFRPFCLKQSFRPSTVSGPQLEHGREKMAGDIVRHVAVIGTGRIGASWTALFLARGLEVAASDPAPGAETFLRGFVAAAWPGLARLSSLPAEPPGRR